MTDYNKMLIDLLNEKIDLLKEKIVHLNIENDSKRKETNRLKRRIKELEKQNDNINYLVKAIDNLSDGDTVLISEGCTHHRQCNDIGSVKIPNWLREYSKKNLIIDNVSGSDFPCDIADYKLIIHCGGCMLTQRQMQARTASAYTHNVPMTNYGMAIAHMNGILKRSLEIFER